MSWLKRAVLKTAIPERVSGVRIPLPPPSECRNPNHLQAINWCCACAIARRVSVPLVSVSAVIPAVAVVTPMRQNGGDKAGSGL